MGGGGGRGSCSGSVVGETTACYSTCSRLQCVPAVVLVLLAVATIVVTLVAAVPAVVAVVVVVVVLVGPSSCFFMMSALL